ncbi:hypothetical protein Shyhy01_70710 [Streptomyces hygroscopicus subsp. hygroscopicus]|nr:hypothetical protein [Streptomyces hygroscopicus]GLX54122.1 hypothetical protein Shyhy01_70710 [Streptomyces hygroscopicus subsp. hygroscopicus]
MPTGRRGEADSPYDAARLSPERINGASVPARSAEPRETVITMVRGRRRPPGTRRADRTSGGRDSRNPIRRARTGEGIRDESGRVDPTRMTTHRFPFGQMERAFEVSDKKLEETVKVLVGFDE